MQFRILDKVKFWSSDNETIVLAIVSILENVRISRNVKIATKAFLHFVTLQTHF